MNKRWKILIACLSLLVFSLRAFAGCPIAIPAKLGSEAREVLERRGYTIASKSEAQFGLIMESSVKDFYSDIDGLVNIDHLVKFRVKDLSDNLELAETKTKSVSGFFDNDQRGEELAAKKAAKLVPKCKKLLNIRERILGER